jgi:hypothetical protein
MLDSLIVILLIAGAVLLASRSVWRTLAGKKSDCGCGSNAGCCSSTCKPPMTKVREIHDTTRNSHAQLG